MIKRSIILILFLGITVCAVRGQYKSKLSIYFEPDLSTLDAGNKEKLEKFTHNKIIKYILIKGFCDSTGSYEYNDALALKRVQSVQKFLLSKKIPKESITVQSKGERVILNKGANEKDMALNRRVDLEMEFTGTLSGKALATTSTATGEKLMVNFSGKVTDEKDHPLEADVILSDYLGKELITTKSNPSGQYNFNILLNLNGLYSLTYYNDTSFIGEKIINLKDPNQSYTNIKTILPKLRGGKSYNMKNLNFYGSEARLLPQSIPSLEALYKLMKKNTTLIIEIQGHVNFPLYQGDPKTTYAPPDNNFKKSVTNEEYLQWLSDERARTVFNYLSGKGIDTLRMKKVGYGNRRMLYPNARDEIESILNRRVEIMVLSFDKKH